MSTEGFDHPCKFKITILICEDDKKIGASKIFQALDRQAAVALIGPRQTGKTTLTFDIAASHKAVYRDLENFDDREKLKNPALFLEKMKTLDCSALIILEEQFWSQLCSTSKLGLNTTACGS